MAYSVIITMCVAAEEERKSRLRHNIIMRTLIHASKKKFQRQGDVREFRSEEIGFSKYLKKSCTLIVDHPRCLGSTI